MRKSNEKVSREKMKTRIISSVVFFPILALMVIMGGNTLVFGLLLLSLIGLNEFYNSFSNNKPIRNIGYLFTGIFYLDKLVLKFYTGSNNFILFVMILILFLLIIIVVNIQIKEKKSTIGHVGYFQLIQFQLEVQIMDYNNLVSFLFLFYLKY